MTLYPDRRPYWAALVASGLLVLSGLWLAMARGGPAAIAAIAAGCLGLGVAVFALIPSRRYLHLTDRGFLYATNFNPKRVDWSDVARLGVATIDGRDRLAWDYAPHYPADVTARAECRRQTGYEAILPPCCRMRPAPLVRLLDERRRAAAGQTAP